VSRALACLLAIGAGCEKAPSSETTSTKPVTVEVPAKQPVVELEPIMAEANKAYDRQDFETMRVHAMRVLKLSPDNVRMLRLMVSAACIEDKPQEAQRYVPRLPARDREQLKRRCANYGVTLVDP
jgi:hypothetical protein